MMHPDDITEASGLNLVLFVNEESISLTAYDLFFHQLFQHLIYALDSHFYGQFFY